MDAKGAGTVNVFVCVTEESLRIRILAALGDRTALPFVELPIESLALGTISDGLDDEGDSVRGALSADWRDKNR